jgi:hypothetical protein
LTIFGQGFNSPRLHQFYLIQITYLGALKIFLSGFSHYFPSLGFFWHSCLTRLVSSKLIKSAADLQSADCVCW